MKKFAIIGFTVALVIAGGWLWLHFKFPSDSQIRHKILGTWTMDLNQSKTIEYKPDGSYLVISTKRRGGGTWEIKDGFIVTIPTNAALFEVYRDKIVSINDSAMVIRHDTEQSTNFISSHKK